MERGRVAFSIPETAEKLNVDVKTVRNAVHRGELPVIKFGRKWLISAAVIDRMLAEGRNPPQAA